MLREEDKFDRQAAREKRKAKKREEKKKEMEKKNKRMNKEEVYNFLILPVVSVKNIFEG